jgi:hypothetical protein
LKGCIQHCGSSVLSAPRRLMHFVFNHFACLTHVLTYSSKAVLSRSRLEQLACVFAAFASVPKGGSRKCQHEASRDTPDAAPAPQRPAKHACHSRATGRIRGQCPGATCMQRPNRDNTMNSSIFLSVSRIF